MRTIKQLVFAALVAGALGSTACRATHASSPRADYGAMVATEAPPAPLDPYFEHRAGHVFVHGRWARTAGQWVWQPGFHERARPGEVYVNGLWERHNGTYVWTMGAWKPARPGFVHVPGHYAFRGTSYVWIRDAWEPERADEQWIAGRWTTRDVYDEGHWSPRSASR